MAASKADIQLYNETSLNLPLTKSVYYKIASAIAEQEQCTFKFIEVVYVDEEEIVRINKEHLERDYITDIITFRYDNIKDISNIEGTLFCCAPRIFEQAKELNQSPKKELKRIFIHGLLHLVGYDDQSKADRKLMTELEDHYLKTL